MVDATPAISVQNNIVNTPQDAVKAARPDILLESSVLSTPVMYSLLFEDIAGKELINIARSDTVNGQKVAYNPIKNLSSLGLKYGPQTLVPVQGSSRTFFDNFPIKLEKKIPDSGTGPFGEVVYIEENTRDLIVNVINLAGDELVEVQILSRGEILDDTIYTEGSN
jgi:hypothetical protein